MARTDILAINAQTISVAGVPIAGSAVPTLGNYTTFDELDADAVLYLNGVLIQGAPYPAMVVTNYTNINVLSGVGLANVVKYGSPSSPATNAATGPVAPISGGSIPANALTSAINSAVLTSAINGSILTSAR